MKKGIEIGARGLDVRGSILRAGAVGSLARARGKRAPLGRRAHQRPCCAHGRPPDDPLILGKPGEHPRRTPNGARWSEAPSTPCAALPGVPAGDVTWGNVPSKRELMTLQNMRENGVRSLAVQCHRCRAISPCRLSVRAWCARNVGLSAPTRGPLHRRAAQVLHGRANLPQALHSTQWWVRDEPPLSSCARRSLKMPAISA
jgi:hypothetical protein